MNEVHKQKPLVSIRKNRLVKHTHQLIVLFILCFMLFPMVTFSAEYQGQNIDGILFDATAYSYSIGKYYYVEVEFDGDEATIYFRKGGYIVVTLDDEEIDDPHSIDAYDYKRSVYWELDIEGLD